MALPASAACRSPARFHASILGKRALGIVERAQAKTAGAFGAARADSVPRPDHCGDGKSAMGNPRWGTATQGRNVAIVLDAGAWSQMRAGNGVPWVNDIRAQANALLQRLPSDDRILLLRADSDGAPLLPFTTDRGAIRAAIAGLQPSSAVADIPRALAEGRSALNPAGVLPKGTPRGLLVYIGPGLMDQQQIDAIEAFRQSLAAASATAAASSADANAHVFQPPEFLVRLVGNAPLQDVGITQIALRRRAEEPDEW